MKRTSSGQREETRAILRVWLESVRSQTGNSFEKIGREAGVDPSNLTRFMKQGSTSGLGLETIRKIAARYGIVPPKDIALDFMPTGLAEPEASRWREQPKQSDATAPTNSIDWWTINSYLLDLEGILKGDRIAFDSNRNARPGDIVIAQQQIGNEVETIIRKYEPPMLVCRTTLRDYPRPEYVDGQRIIIMGSMVALRRDIAHPAAAE